MWVGFISILSAIAAIVIVCRVVLSKSPQAILECADETPYRKYEMNALKFMAIGLMITGLLGLAQV